LALNPIIAQAVTMGDDFHVRNTAASSLLFRQLAPKLVEANPSGKDLQSVLDFLAGNNEFFLTLELAAGKATLEQAGVVVMPSNAAAVRHALSILDRRPAANTPAGPVARLLAQRPRVINVGLREFADALVENDVAVVQYDWRPVAGGDRRMQQLLDALGS
jgi:hypothetical protein